MKKLLSLPPNLVECFHRVTGLGRDEYFCTCDPVGHKLGSGGGTTWVLQECRRCENSEVPFGEWLSQERRIILHGGGQSRRLPAYAPSGKMLMPLPVFRWERGQQLTQTLLSQQLPLYEKIMSMAPANIHTMIASGDVLIRATQPLQPVPDADVVCYGLWLDSSIAKDHGVFVSDRKTPGVLKQMLQKPTVETLNSLLDNHYYLTDIGVWLLSDRAVELLARRSMAGDKCKMPNANCELKEYDLYSEFGCALGTDPTIADEEIGSLNVAVMPLPGGEFYHFGTSREMITSMMSIQNLVNDQREIMHRDRKPHPSIFVQNSDLNVGFTDANQNIWIENSYIDEGWTFTHDNIVTGVPPVGLGIRLEPGQCIDFVSVGDSNYCVRRYNIDDKFAGEEQQRKQFPVVTSEMSPVDSCLLSAEDISNQANLMRIAGQRDEYRKKNLQQMARNWRHSVFYQLDLNHTRTISDRLGVAMPEPVDSDAPLITRMQDAMFRGDSDTAFGLLRHGLTVTALSEKQHPHKDIYDDQIVWGRSPVRIDISGGWTDTPPFCLMEGGNVVNIAIELNGQQPIQAFVKPCKEYHVLLRSIDLGACEVVETYEQLADYKKVGSPFSIPKAALSLAGFLPRFSDEHFDSLRTQLEAFGCGIELTLLSAIPAGSGLGTSSILAATVLGAVSDFCSLSWDKHEICKRTLVLEQMLTTGGGWQDQYGGVLGGVKLLQTTKGFEQTPTVRWIPDDVFTQPEYRQCHLLYYTGITRTAKKILTEIVCQMFLNENSQLTLLRDMKSHALDMYEAIQRNNFRQMGLALRRNWLQNQALDSGTNPADVQRITNLVDDLCLGYKLPGAGGGGYLYMVAKDPEAAARIQKIINENRCNANARFVEMSLSKQGLQISRS